MQDFFAKYKIEDEVIAAGVSGGADSLALVIRLQQWAKIQNKKIVALTVDHQLRPESAAEADYVAGLMQRLGIEHHILVWDGDKPVKGIEEEARMARYHLLQKWCAEHNVRVLATGHHRRDQAETFLLRLQRGSGLYGLSGILPVSRRGELMIIRPQLEDTPSELKEFLQKQGIEWVEDPSNQCEDFMRVKIRNYLPILEKELGISEQRLADTAAVLSRTRAYIEEQVDKVVKNQAREFADGLAFALPEKTVAELSQEICYRVLAQLIRRGGKKEYVPEGEEMLRLCCNLQHCDEFKGCTLGGCEIFKAMKKIWIVPELGCKKILAKKDWEAFCSRNPQYGKMTLPYKVRRVIEHFSHNENAV